MANNPYVNKVVFNNNTLIDLSSDTVTASKLAQGYTAHSASGAQITGTMPEGGGGEYDIEGTTLASGGQQLDITDAGGGSSITVEPITITTNGTTTAPSGKAYSPITINVPQTTINSLSVTENGTYTAPAGTAYSPITVNVSGGGDSGLKKADLDANGNVTYPTSLDVSAIKTIPNNILGQWQYNNTALTGVLNFTNLQTMGNASLASGFQNCQNITGVHFPALTSIGNNGLGYCFFACVRIASISFPSLVSVQANAFSNAFTYCQALSGSISFPSLTTITGNAFFANTFQNCPNVTAIHFKSSIQSTIEGQTGYASKFGATNATIYFDLP